MPDPRNSKSLASRVDITFPTRTGGMRAKKRWLCWALLFLPALFLALFGVAGDHRIYQAGPVAPVHRFIARDCWRCHQDTWPLAKWVFTAGGVAGSTPDAACSACHAGPAHNGHPQAAMKNCAYCHREHRGQEQLSAVGASLCTECHAMLKAGTASPLHFVGSVPDLDHHPEFALFRADEPPASDPANPIHGVYRVAKRDDAGAWRDRAALRFNHRQHMTPGNPRGLAMPIAHDASGKVVQEAGFTRLECESCHQPRDDGRYFHAINFEQHCQRCHPLEFGGTSILNRQLPHEQLDLVRDVLVSRLVAEIKAAPPDSTTARESPVPSLPAGIPGARTTTAGLTPDEAVRLENTLAEAEHTVYGKEAKGACRFCHTLGENDGRLQVVPPSIPDRWQEHARFDHAAHRFLTCAECHKQALSSAETSDILLPRIATCRTCHADGGRPPRGASDACVECHEYHDHAGERFEGVLTLGLEHKDAPSRVDPANNEQ